MSDLTVEQAMQTALRHHQAGRLAEAEAIYRQVLAHAPHHPDALHLLGILATHAGRSADAVDLIRRAIAVAPNVPELHNNLAKAYFKKGDLDAAIAACRVAIALRPNFPEACQQLGNSLFRKGERGAAAAAYRQAIALRPNYPEAYSNLGTALLDLGEIDAAIEACRQAIAFRSDYPEAHYNLGNGLLKKKDLDAAIAAYRQTILLRPSYAEAHSNLANALFEKGQREAAIVSWRQAIALQPNYPIAYNNLANALGDQGDVDAAIAACRQAIALQPNYPEACCNLASALKDAGQLDGAIAGYRQALSLNPDFHEAHSNLLIALNYHPDSTSESLLEESRKWAARFAEPVGRMMLPHANDRNPDRRLKVGYVSPELWNHVVGRALLPFLEQCDADQFESFCYSTRCVADAVTHRIRAAASQWREAAGLSAEELVQRIRADQIDILVDLSGHCSHNRLLAFARKPAPVQVTWLGYPGTTGLSAMDYRITDPCLDPPDPAGARDALYTERSIRLPTTAFCYRPSNETIPTNPLPALATGRVTFGCLNNLCKVSPPTLEAWIQILRTAPSSDLLLYAAGGESRRRMTDLIAQGGIDPSRVRFVSHGGARYFEIYHQIDIALDPFPYSGSTTTCDSLWMGVPVVTLTGPRIVSRLSLTILSALGLTELAAHDAQEYIKLATGLAIDLPRLAEMRTALRQRMAASPLMDAPRFARNMETAYRNLWRNWCAQTRTIR